jgi:hypothetical protein
MKDDVLLLLSEREVDMNVMAIDQPGSSADGSTDIRPNEQNVNNCPRTTRLGRNPHVPCSAPFLFHVSRTFDRMIEQRQRMTCGLLPLDLTMLIKKLW